MSSISYIDAKLWSGDVWNFWTNWTLLRQEVYSIYLSPAPTPLHLQKATKYWLLLVFVILYKQKQ